MKVHGFNMAEDFSDASLSIQIHWEISDLKDNLADINAKLSLLDKDIRYKRGMSECMLKCHCETGKETFAIILLKQRFELAKQISKLCAARAKTESEINEYFEKQKKINRRMEQIRPYGFLPTVFARFWYR